MFKKKKCVGLVILSLNLGFILAFALPLQFLIVVEGLLLICIGFSIFKNSC